MILILMMMMITMVMMIMMMAENIQQECIAINAVFSAEDCVRLQAASLLNCTQRRDIAPQG